MENYDSIFTEQEKPDAKSFDPFNKEAWAQRKQADRQTAFTLIDETAQDIAQDGEMFRSCLDVMARFDRYSVGNILLLTNQKPEAVKLADFDTWKKSNCFIKKGENGILLLEPGEEFRREDGSVGVNYNVKRLFDISQTTSRQQSAPQTNYDMRLLLKSMLRHAPCPIVISENVPENIGAVYDAAEKKILVRQGMDGPEIFRSLSQELAHAHFDKGNYNRADHAFSGYCVAYTLCKRYGVDTANFHFHTMPASFQSMDAKAIRSEVSKIRDCTNQISMDMSRVLNKRPKERTDNGR